MKKNNLLIIGLALSFMTGAGVSLNCNAANNDYSDEDLKSMKSLTKIERAIMQQSLLHSCENLLHNTKAPYRAGRLLITTELLASLQPQSPQAFKYLTDIYQTQDKIALAIATTENYLKIYPNDYTANINLLHFKLDQADNAEQRDAVLANTFKNEKLPNSVRSEAAIEIAKLLAARGDENSSQKFIEQSLKLDPLNYSALLMRLDVTSKPPIKLKLKTLIAMLKSNPRSITISRELGNLLAELGLHKDSLLFLDHSWKVANKNKPLHSAPTDFACEYISTLLDMSDAEKAIKLFGRQTRYSTSKELLTLLAEAYGDLALKNDKYAEKSKVLISRIKRTYKKDISFIAAAKKVKRLKPEEIEENDKKLAKLNLDYAWFELLAQNNVKLANQAALEAKKLDVKGEGITLLLLTTEFRTTSKDSPALGTLIKKLETFAKKEILANYFLADYYLQQEKLKLAKPFIIAGLKLNSSGVAYRRLKKMARENNIKIPATKGSDIATKLIKNFNKDYLAIGVDPSKAIKITLSTDPTSVGFSQPLIITAKLTNKSKLPIVIGKLGLVSNRIALDAKIRELFRFTKPNLPVVILPASRYLMPGKSLKATVRVDTGKLAKVLSANPLRKLTLELNGIISPIETVSGIQSDLSSLKPARLTIKRLGILPSFDKVARPKTVARYAAQYQKAISDIGKMLESDNVAVRAQGAQKIAELIHWQQMPVGRIRWIEKLKTAQNLRALRSLFAAALADKSPAVRVQALTYIQLAVFTPELTVSAKKLYKDKNPIVRYRLCETLGISSRSANRKKVQLFLKDANKFVRKLAKLFEIYFKQERELQNTL